MGNHFRVSRYTKFVVTLVGAVVYSLWGYLNDDVLTDAEILTAILAGLQAIGVYVLPNTPTPSEEEKLTK